MTKEGMDDFKRPTHPDFMDTQELKAIEFSGLRENQLSQSWEIWLGGSVKDTVSFELLKFNPLALEDAFAKVFALHEVEVKDTLDHTPLIRKE